MSSIENPEHYTQGGIHCIDAMVSAYGIQDVSVFSRLNAFKYIWRAHTHKAGREENTRKAIWFLRVSIGDDPRE